MFAGDWRLAVMAYNAGEYRVLGALRRSGQTARNAKPEALPGLSPITHAYVQQAARAVVPAGTGRRPRGMAAGARSPGAAPAGAQTLPEPASTASTTWARAHGQDAAQLQRFNPVFADGRHRACRAARRCGVLAPVPRGTRQRGSRWIRASGDRVASAPAWHARVADVRPASPDAPLAITPSRPRRHRVDHRRPLRHPRQRAAPAQRPRAGSVLRPGKVLLIDPARRPGRHACPQDRTP